MVDKVNKEFAYYPDVTVYCGKPQHYNDDEKSLTNPRLVVEVLSPSTAHIDKGTKLYHYQTIDSLTDYLIVYSDVPRIERWYRNTEQMGEWSSDISRGINDSIEITSLNFSLKLRDLYGDILR